MVTDAGLQQEDLVTDDEWETILKRIQQENIPIAAIRCVCNGRYNK
jgi:hypothetical protein